MKEFMFESFTQVLIFFPWSSESPHFPVYMLQIPVSGNMIEKDSTVCLIPPESYLVWTTVKAQSQKPSKVWSNQPRHGFLVYFPAIIVSANHEEDNSRRRTRSPAPVSTNHVITMTNWTFVVLNHIFCEFFQLISFSHSPWPRKI
jgi:hypothetical protein